MAIVFIRKRDRKLASPPEGTRQSWTEYQVVEGRKVLSRHDSYAQAKAAFERFKGDGKD